MMNMAYSTFKPIAAGSKPGKNVACKPADRMRAIHARMSWPGPLHKRSCLCSKSRPRELHAVSCRRVESAGHADPSPRCFTEPHETTATDLFPKTSDQFASLLAIGGVLYALTPTESWAYAPTLAASEVGGLGAAFLDFLLHNPFITLGFSAAAVWVVPKLVKGVFRKFLFPALGLLLLFGVATHPIASWHLGLSVIAYVQEHPVLSSITIILFASLALTPYILLLLGAVALFFGGTQLAQIQLPQLPFQSSPVVSQLSPLESGLVRFGSEKLQQKAAPFLAGTASSKSSAISGSGTVMDPEVLPPEVPTPQMLFNKLKGFGTDFSKTGVSKLKGLARTAQETVTETLTPERLTELQTVAAQKLEETQKAIKDPEAYTKFRMAARQATKDQLNNLSTTLIETGEKVIAPVNNDVRLITETGQGMISTAQQTVDTVKNTALAVKETVETVATQVQSVDPTKAVEMMQSTVQDVTKSIPLASDSVTSTLEVAEKTAKDVVDAVSTGKVMSKENREAVLESAKKTAEQTAEFVKENVLTEENISKAKEVSIEGLKVTKDVAVKTWDFTSRFVVKFGQELIKLSGDSAAR